ncbi:glycine betaine ABC transporter substrate-binding protein [Quadrisphaera sp. GCM10027208]|uniref:glycine betaine ABC transporter substrate-binding protein n=1 Tax=Quadrisphaera sp. GCM10027208 TaxID=3273423 RepID=UPI003611C7EE
MSHPRKGSAVRQPTKLIRTTGLLTGALVLSACGASNTGSGDTEETTGAGGEQTAAASQWGDCDMTEGLAPVPDPEGTGEDADTTVDIGVFSGWDESYAASYLYANVLEGMGYTVNLTEYEAAPMYTGLADGDIDISLDTWLPLTHEDYLEQYGEDMTSLGCWYDNAKLTIAVNEDAPVESLAELNEHAEEFGGVLYGIEPGAGLTRITKEEAIPTYGLDDFEFRESSTPAMLSELKSATESGENIVVTLWRPHWAYDAFPVRDLEDPEGAMGEAEFIYSFGRGDIEEEMPNVAQLVRNFVFTDEQLAELENLMFSEEHYAGEDHEAAVAEWLEANPEFVDQLKAGELG